MNKLGDTTGPDLATWGNGGSDTIYRLREGVERFIITDINNPAGSAKAQSNVFVMFDYLSVKSGYFSHVPGGCNVLYFDGHVEFVHYPSDIAPITRASGARASAGERLAEGAAGLLLMLMTPLLCATTRCR